MFFIHTSLIFLISEPNFETGTQTGKKETSFVIHEADINFNGTNDFSEVVSF